VTLVIDASAALYLLASEQGIEPFGTFDLVSPALLWSEVTSVLNEMRWRRELSPALAQTAFDRLLASPIERRTDDGLYRDAREVARTLGWAKTYDAEYVALARALQVGLLSRDDRLRRGAARLITVVTPDELVPPEHPTGSDLEP
jgi:predicted nucleic acid-binding protein